MATTTIGAPGVTFPDSSVQASATTGVPVLNVYTTPGTWTKPATVKAIKVTVVGGGGSVGVLPGSPVPNSGTTAGGAGGGGTSIRVYPAPTIPGPQPYSVGAAGSSSSFGVNPFPAPFLVISATGGSNGSTYPASSGAGAQGGAGGIGSGGQLNIAGQAGSWGRDKGGAGGSSYLGGGGVGNGSNGGAYGGGGGGNVSSSSPASGGTGATGVVIVEEFY